jgi:WS/DGAT/MGAT family acyltransferase
MHIGSLAIYDPSTAPGGRLDFNRVQRWVASRLHRANALRERMVDVPLKLDKPYWINDPDFDIEYHLRHAALPGPGTWEQLCKMAAFIFASPLDRSKPLWEVYVVEGLSGVEVMSVSNDPSPDAADDDVHDDWTPEPKPRRRELLALAALHATQAPRQVARSSSRLASGLAKGAAVLTAASTERGPGTLPFLAPRIRFSGVVSAHRVFGGERFRLSDIKAIKNSQEGLKLNDVVLAICAGSMRRYLQKHNDLPDKPLLAMVPVSVRPENEKESGGNQVAIMSVPLGTHLADPLRCLRFIQTAQSQRKALLHAVGGQQLQEYSTLFPSAFAGIAARVYTQGHLANRAPQVFNTVITNVPGPPVPIYNCGAKMLDMFGLVPSFDGMGLGHVVNSYNGSLTIGFNSCPEMMPDPGFYSACIRDSFSGLWAACGLPQN